MKKKLLIPVVLLVILAIVIPIINGIIAEKTVKNYFASINEKASDIGYTAKLISYDRHLYSSDFKWEFDMGMFKELHGVEKIIVNDHASHGYTSITATNDLMENTWYSNFVNTRLGGKNPLTSKTTYSVFGKISTECTTTPFDLKIKDETLHFGAGKLTGETDAGIGHIILSGNMDGISVPEKLSLGKITLDYDIESVSTYIWKGKVSCLFDSVRADDQNEHFDAENLKTAYTLGYDPDRKTISADGTFSLDSMTINEKTVRNIAGKIAWNNVDSAGYEAFIKQYIETIKPLLPMFSKYAEGDQDAMLEIESQMMATNMQLAASLESLLKKDLELDISDVSMEFPEGKLTADFNIKLLKDMTLIQFLPLVSNPGIITDIFSLDTKIDLPSALFQDFVPQLTTPLHPAMQTGFFINKGDTLSLDARTDGNKLLLNGNELNLNMFR